MTTVCLPDEQGRQLLGDVPPGIEVVDWAEVLDGRVDPASVDMLVPPYGTAPPDAAELTRLAGLKLVQLLSAGVEPWVNRVPDGVVLCSGRGIHGASTAELAVAGLLSVLRELPRFRDAQLTHRWEPHHTEGLDGSRVLVLGAGDIGSRVAAALSPLGAEPTLVARRPRPGLATLAELPDLLPAARAVVIALPLTPATRGLVDAQFLAAMPDSAVLVNVARGPIVDTAALVAELKSGRLRAFLDVTDPEPLLAEHPLWSAHNLVLTPHIGGGTTGWQRRGYRLVCEQAIRLHRGEPLVNVVTEGY